MLALDRRSEMSLLESLTVSRRQTSLCVVVSQFVFDREQMLIQLIVGKEPLFKARSLGIGQMAEQETDQQIITFNFLFHYSKSLAVYVILISLSVLAVCQHMLMRKTQNHFMISSAGTFQTFLNTSLKSGSYSISSDSQRVHGYPERFCKPLAPGLVRAFRFVILGDQVYVIRGQLMNASLETSQSMFFFRGLESAVPFLVRVVRWRLPRL